MIRGAFRRRHPTTTASKPYRHTVMEGFIDDYNRLRLLVALAGLALLAVAALAGTRSWVIGINAVSMGIIVIHSGWCMVAGVRSPRLALTLDITATSLAAWAVVNIQTRGVSLALWCVLITFLTYGRWRYAFYAYTTLWYLLIISRDSPVQELATTFRTIFIVAVIVLVLISVSRRMLMLELQRSQLLGSVSHELRNQLTGVMGMIDLALDEEAAPAPREVRDLISLARREAADATDLIEDLLTASRMESNVLDVTFEPVDLDLEVARVVDHYPSDGMSIQHTGPRSGVVALADQVRLRQVLRNLLSNAVRYGGHSISISVHPEGAIVHIKVLDDGPGVPAGEEETIFLPYRRAANVLRHRSSVGLGLWISRRLAKAMGGDLTYGRVNTQTVFQLTLPVFVPLALPEPTAAGA